MYYSLDKKNKAGSKFSNRTGTVQESPKEGNERVLILVVSVEGQEYKTVLIIE